MYAVKLGLTFYPGMTLKPVLLRTQPIGHYTYSALSITMPILCMMTCWPPTHPISHYAYPLHDDMLATYTLKADLANYHYLSVG